MSNDLNLFATVLTYAAPSSNYHGESEENRTVIQRITKGGHEYAVVSPEAMRNALREILAKRGLPVNRKRVRDADQLAVQFQSVPDAEKYADDFLFGFMVVDKSVKTSKERPIKRDSVLRMNMAMALSPYRFNSTFHQSPKNVDSSWQNSSNSALIHREVSHTAFQYPFALALGDCRPGSGPTWARALLGSIGELSNVAGGHARSYYEMAPRSIVIRLTRQLVAGINTYGFDERGGFEELSRIRSGDLPGEEFWVGGEIARMMPVAERERLANEGVHLLDSPQHLLREVADAADLEKAS